MKFYINCSREITWCWELWQTSGITWLLQVLQVRTLPVVQNRHTFMCSVPCKSLHWLAEFHISIMFSSVCSTETVGYVSTQEATWLVVNITSHTRRALYKVAMTTVESSHVERVEYYQLFHHLHLTGKGRSFLDTPAPQREGLEMKPRNDLKC